MTERDRMYVPAAGRHWRLPFYDMLARLLGAGRGRKQLMAQISCDAGARILEIGCGTGEMLLLLKRAHSDAQVVGLDPDPSALERARRKLRRAGLAAQLDEGFAEELPYGDGFFQVVVSSLMFHHLAREDKARALAEIVRVLEPGGRFDMLDLTEPASHGHGFLFRRLHMISHLKDNREAQVLKAMLDAGLADARVAARVTQRFSSMVCYRADAPGGVRNNA